MHRLICVPTAGGASCRMPGKGARDPAHATFFQHGKSRASWNKAPLVNNAKPSLPR
jgi:hypothetical protein